MPVSEQFVGVLRARWVVPVDGDPIPDAAVAVGPEGTITGVGPAATVACPPGGAIVDLGEAAICPGLVNTHAHPELTALRGAVEDLLFLDWLKELTRLKHEGMTPEESRRSTLLGVAEAIAAGVTTLAAPDDAGFLAAALVDAGLRGIVYREVFGPDPREWREAFERGRARVEETRAAATGLVRAGVSPHAPYTVSDPLMRAVAEWAAAETLPVCVHVAESEAEDQFVRNGAGDFAEYHQSRGIPVVAHGVSPVAWLERCGVLAARPLLVHCVRADDADLERVARAGGAVAHCPISNARLGHGVAPLETMLALGVSVGLGSDSAVSNNRMDLLEEARVAGLVQRAVYGTPDRFSAGELLRLATLGGAEALGWADRIGSLRPGKDADLIAVRLDGVHVRPVHDPLAALIQAARASDVEWTMVRGRTLYRSGRWTTLDVPPA